MRRSHIARLAFVLSTALLGASECSNDTEDPPPSNMVALTTGNRLAILSTDDARVSSVVPITNLATSESVVAIDRRPLSNQLFGLTSTGRLLTIDVITGEGTFRANLAADPADTSDLFTALSGTEFGLDFNPVVDRLRVVSNTGQNLRIHPETGATITDAPLNVAGAARTGITGATYTDSFAAACRTTLFYLDTAADRLFSSSDPNAGTLTEVGALGLDAGAINGFDIATGSDSASSAFGVWTTPAGISTLHRIDLSTGAATAAGAIVGLASGESVRGIALGTQRDAPAQSSGELLALTESNRLVSFNRGAPQKLCTGPLAVTGLQASESLLGIDLRPATGAVVALGSTGRVYTLNTATGAATLLSTLAADASDTTAAFSALSGNAFGIDFNPVVNLLRVVSDGGQNLRVNVDSGATITDAPLNPGTPLVSAAAYNGNVAGAGATTLYVLDSGSDRLLIQGQPSGSPNNGDLQDVGALGVDAAAVNGFDISGASGQALAALSVAGATTAELFAVDLTSGAATRINAIGVSERLRGLTFLATPTATVFGVTQDNRLVSFSPGTPGTLADDDAISGLQGGENVIGLDFRPADRKLYALSSAGRLYTLDTATSAATLAATLAPDTTTNPAETFSALAGTDLGVDFNPVVDRLRVVGDARQNLRINPASGATLTDTPVSHPASVTAAAYTNSFAPSPDAARTTALFVIDTQSDRLLRQDPPNAGTLVDVGRLTLDGQRIDVTAVNGFEIVGPDTAPLALVALETAANPTGFYSLELGSGALTLVGNVAAGAAANRVDGLSAAPSAVAPPIGSTVFALVNGTTLVSFARNAPGAATTVGPVSGLLATETLLGIDFRPANGALYGLGSSGRVYTIDTATAAATLAATLAADPADLSEPFTTLSGTRFGLDFNPVPDRLRVVSDSGQNLRINVDNGTTTTDNALNYAAPTPTAAAYSRSFAGAAATSLFVIDTASNALMLQSPPNLGTLTTIGALSAAQQFQGANGFDIAGADDGIALAALLPVGATQSTLFSVNLRTGAVTSRGTIGPAGTVPLRGLALRLQ